MTHAFNRYDVVTLLGARAGIPAGAQGQVLGWYRRPSETTYVVAFGEVVLEDVHDDELELVRGETARVVLPGSGDVP
jgi:hypothetical protein